MTLLLEILSIIAIIASLFAFLYYQKKKAAKRRHDEMQNRFNEMARQEGLDITEQEHLDIAIIGHDTERNILLFVTSDAWEEIPVKKVKLDDITSCKITNKINYGTAISEIRLDLEGRIQRASLLFYRNHSEGDLGVAHLGASAETWQKLVLKNMGR